MATLSSVRLDFVKLTGRRDLLENSDLDANVDNGANYYINGGQRLLDLECEHQKSTRRWMGVLSSGEFQVEIQNLIAIQELTIVKVDERIDMRDLYLGPAEFRREYAEPIKYWDSDEGSYTTVWTTGEPEAWTLNVIGLSPEQKDQTESTFKSAGILDFSDLKFGADYAYDGILFYPIADQDYTVDAWGRFFSPELSDDDDTSFWSVMYPELLAIAGCYFLETMYQDDARANFWRNAMAPWLSKIDDNLVEYEQQGRDRHENW